MIEVPLYHPAGGLVRSVTAIRRDPELRYPQNELLFVGLRLGANTQTAPHFHRVVAWLQLVDTCAGCIN